MNINCDYKISTKKYNTALFNSRRKSQNNFQNYTSACKNIVEQKSNDSNYITNIITFKSSLPLYMQLKKEVEPILVRNIVFGPNEYKNLSKTDLITLRKFGEFFKGSNVTRFILDFGEMFSNQIHNKYPEGFVFVSVGRSPAFLGKFLEFQGEDVKYCPISGLSRCDKISQNFIEKYKKYLDTIGLTKEFVENSQKPIIISDYTNTGLSLYRFEAFLALPEIGIKGDKIIYSPIANNGFSENKNSIFNCSWTDLYYKNVDYDISEEYGRIMSLSLHKDYTSIPMFYTWFGNYILDDILGKFYNNGNKFEENFDTKMVNFLIAERANAISNKII